MYREPLLKVDNLVLGFGSKPPFRQVLKGVSFQIDQGEIVAVVGESGSGKSVTALSVLQLLPKKTTRYLGGQINFSKDGKTALNLLDASEEKLQSIRGNDISMIFQEPMSALNPVFTCGDQVMEAVLAHHRYTRQEAKQRTIELFGEVQLPYPELMFNRYPHEISGGQKQRVMIAMAIACRPALLIADEPTTALDVTVQKNILQLLTNLQAQTKMGLLFITHDLGLVQDFADRVIVMYQGVIVEQGRCDDLFASPQHPYTRALLACRPILYKKGQQLPVVSDFLNGLVQHEMVTVQPPSLQTELIHVNNLKVWFPKKKNWLGKATDHIKAVDDLCFSIFQGETLGIVGESGCGKTTLGRALLQLQPASGGQVYFREREITSLPGNKLRAERKGFQLVFQDPYGSLNPRLTIGEAIRETLVVHHPRLTVAEQRDRVLELLERVQLLPEHYHRYPHAFSGGQRQRIGIARALALNPEFIVFDESVSALDVSVQAQVLNLINELKARYAFTAAFITHDLGVVQYISDRIMVLKRGRIAELGLTEQVMNHPKSDYTRELLDAIPGKGKSFS